jgi:GNAT superfamily N-acetyltransferase
MQTGYHNGLATPFPFLGPLEMGIQAAFYEELMYRLIGIGLVFWLFRKRWLALLIPGILWAVAHLTYVRDPFYLRGIELTIAAVFIFGLFFWKYGLLTAIMGHISINALLGAIILFRSPEPKFFLSGWVIVVVLLVPVIPGAIQAMRCRLSGSPPANPVVRPASALDIPLLATLPCDIADWHTIFSTEYSQLYVLALGDTVVGAAWGTVDMDAKGSVDGIYVAPAWRRQYWGTRLLNALRTSLEAMGATQLSVGIEAHQKTEKSFWASLGWRPAQQILSPQSWPPIPPSPKTLRKLGKES